MTEKKTDLQRIREGVESALRWLDDEQIAHDDHSIPIARDTLRKVLTRIKNAEGRQT